jgi:uncharacterized membrane protein (UPF0127 family)
VNNPLKGLFLSALCFLLLFISCGCSIRAKRKVCVNNTCVIAEIADSPQQRNRGLMFRKDLDDKHGMLFVFEGEARYGFWMKNMNFPIDIIWIDGNRDIIDIYEDALPCKDICKTMLPRAAAQFVLEVKSGFVRTKRIKAGDKVFF